MKKILILTMLIICASTIFAQVEFNFSTELGTILDTEFSVQDMAYNESYAVPAFAKIQPEVDLFGFINIFGSMQLNTYCLDMSRNEFVAMNAVAKCGITLNLQGLLVNYEFMKVLPISPYENNLSGSNVSYHKISAVYSTRNLKNR
jgi:hypothetical protein